MKDDDHAPTLRIDGLRTSGPVIIDVVKGTLEIKDADVGSLTVIRRAAAATTGESSPAGVVGQGLLQVAVMFVTAGASHALGLG